MTIVIEDGTCVPGANGVVSLEEVRAFLASIAIDSAAFLDADLETALVKSLLFAKQRYSSRLLGVPKCPGSMLLDFPRTFPPGQFLNMYWNDGVTPLTEPVPVGYKQCVLWGLLVVLGEQPDILGDAATNDVAKVGVDGLYEVWYDPKAIPALPTFINYREMAVKQMDLCMEPYVTAGGTGIYSLERA